MSAPPREDGFSLVAVVAGVTIMLILMGAAMPTWKYVVMSDREEELFFRGDSIASAIERFQRKNGNALPTSLDQLVKGRYLRKAYKDPMTKDGKWRFVRPGEGAALPGRPGGPRPPGAVDRTSGTGGTSGPGPTAGTRPSASPSPASGLGAASGSGSEIGAIAGVGTRATGTSYKLMNGRDKYEEWLFLAGQPRGFGKMVLPMQNRPGGAQPPGGSTTTPGGNRP